MGDKMKHGFQLACTAVACLASYPLQAQAPGQPTAPARMTGEYWAAKTALGYGLIDRLGDLRSVLRERFGKDVLTPLVATERGLFGRRVPGVGAADALGASASLAEDIVSAIEARAMWARYGL